MRAALLVAIALAAPKAVPKADPVPSLPAPPLTLTVAPGSGGAAWTLRVENTGEGPIRIAADPALLSLEVTPPNGKPITCKLPEDARPQTDEGQELVVPAKRSWSAAFDPMFYCFSAKERDALVAGASVVARLGWPTRAKLKNAASAPSAPYVAAPVGAAVGKVGSAKEIASAPFSLGETYVVLPAPAPADATSAIALTVPDTIDVARGGEIPITVTATNETDRALTLLFRPETLSFRVTGAGGSVACGAARAIGSPIRELYSTLGAKAKTAMTVLVSTFCPSDTFDDPGVYRIYPKLDTTGASGRGIGLRTWDDTTEGRMPTLLRVRGRRQTSERPRPTLDPAPGGDQK